MKTSPLDLIDKAGLELLRKCILKNFQIFGDKQGNVIINYSQHKAAYDILADFYKSNYIEYFDSVPDDEKLKQFILKLIEDKLKN